MFYGNDFSHAVANGIEATFSRNQFVNNKVDDCWHGVWGGYSFDSLFQGNSFVGSTDGIAIEHGQGNAIYGNTFSKNDTAIRLWANATQDPSWGYAKARDTRSRDYTIYGNTFDGNKLDVSTLRTDGVDLKKDGAVPAFTPVPERPDGMKALMSATDRRGRATIIVDEWGPYDYQSPKLWPVGKPTDRPLKLRVLGPEGRWTLKSLTGGTTKTTSGVVSSELVISPSGAVTDVNVAIEYEIGRAHV